MSEVAQHVREAFDCLMDKAIQWPNTFNLTVLGGFVVEHPELVGRELHPSQIAAREYRERIRNS